MGKIAQWIPLEMGRPSSWKRLWLLTPIASALGAAMPARALTIYPTFDGSIAADLAPADAASWQSAINYAAARYQQIFSDPITVNITFKAVTGTSILGQSNTRLQTIGNYAAAKAALTADASSIDDATAVANLPAADPTGGGTFRAAYAQAKALGLRPANSGIPDGTITFGAGYSYTYDPNHRAVAGSIDFIGIAEHEISEVLGRIGILGNTFGGTQASYSLLDLFGYTGPGILDLTPDQEGVNFSIDGGNTLLKLYNDASNGGDNKDWAPGSNDSFDAAIPTGVALDISSTDLREMDVIGYHLGVPEPDSFASLIFGLGMLARRCRGRVEPG